MNSTDYKVIEMDDLESNQDEEKAKELEHQKDVEKAFKSFIKEEKGYSNWMIKHQILHLSLIKKINLSKSDITKLPKGLFNGCNSLTKVVLSNNKIKEIPDDLFTGCCTSLKSIILTDNYLAKLQDGLFKNCIKLKKIYLDKNFLKLLPSNIFSGCIRLEIVDLGDNELNELPVDLFKECPSLIDTNFDLNGLRKIPNDLFKGHKSLKFVSFHGNQLEILDDELFRGCSGLDDVDLSSNKLKQLSADLLSDCKNLKSCHFDSNKLINLPSSLLKECTQIQAIEFDDNQISLLPKNFFRGCNALKHVNFDHNEIKILPDNLFKGCAELKFVNIHHNLLQELSANLFKDCSNLKSVDFSNNSLENLPESLFKGCKHLAKVDFKFNRLNNLHDDLFIDCDVLERIDFSNNRIKEYPTSYTSRCIHLKRINFSNNLLKELPHDAFVHLKSLTEVDFSTNQLERLDIDFNSNKNLKQILFSENKLTDINFDKFKNLNNDLILDFRHNKIDINNFVFIYKEFMRIGKIQNCIDFAHESCNRDKLYLLKNTDTFTKNKLLLLCLSKRCFTRADIFTDDKNLKTVKTLNTQMDKLNLNKISLLDLLLSTKDITSDCLISLKNYIENLLEENTQLHNYEFKFKSSNSIVEFCNRNDNLLFDSFFSFNSFKSWIESYESKTKEDDIENVENETEQDDDEEDEESDEEESDEEESDEEESDEEESDEEESDEEECETNETDNFMKIAKNYIFEKNFSSFYFKIDYSTCFEIILDNNNEQMAIHLMILMKFIVSYEMSNKKKKFDQIIKRYKSLSVFNERFSNEFLSKIFELKWTKLINFILDYNSSITQRFLHLNKNFFDNNFNYSDLWKLKKSFDDDDDDEDNLNENSSYSTNSLDEDDSSEICSVKAKAKEDTNDDDILYHILRLRNGNILRHKTTKVLLEERWSIAGYFYYINLTFYLIYLICYSINIECFGKNFNAPNKFEFGTRIVSIIFVIYFIILEVLQFIILRNIVTYFVSLKNIIEAITFPLSLITLCIKTADFGSYQTKSALFSSTIILSYFILLCRLDKFWTIGPYVNVFGNIARRSVKLLLIVFICIIGFLLAFRNRAKMFSPDDSPENLMIVFNNTFSASFMSLTTMAIGEVTASELGIEHLTHHNIINFILYLIFIFLLPILFLNIFTGISIDEVSKLVENSEAENISIKIDYILRFEEIINANDLTKKIVSYFFKANFFHNISEIKTLKYFSLGVTRLFKESFRKHDLEIINKSSSDELKQGDNEKLNYNLSKILNALNQQSNRMNKIVTDMNQQSNEINQVRSDIIRLTVNMDKQTSNMSLFVSSVNEQSNKIREEINKVASYVKHLEVESKKSDLQLSKE